MNENALRAILLLLREMVDRPELDLRGPFPRSRIGGGFRQRPSVILLCTFESAYVRILSTTWRQHLGRPKKDRSISLALDLSPATIAKKLHHLELAEARVAEHEGTHHIALNWDEKAELKKLRRAGRNLSRRERRAQRREEKLTRFYPERVCPLCRRVVADTIRWSLKGSYENWSCRACAVTQKPQASLTSVEFPLIASRTWLTSSALILGARSALGISQARMAELLGVSRAEYAGAESGRRPLRLSDEAARTLLNALWKRGVDVSNLPVDIAS
jgi:DNA-binding transcriptional regulator YiaG